VQLAGGELPNELRHSRAADDDALRNRDFQRDGEHVVLVRLLFDPACVSDKLRPAISFAINKSDPLVCCLSQPH
jgi:hypothetical protein